MDLDQNGFIATPPLPIRKLTDWLAKDLDLQSGFRTNFRYPTIHYQESYQIRIDLQTHGIIKKIP